MKIKNLIYGTIVLITALTLGACQGDKDPQTALDWYPEHGYKSVFRMLDDEIAEVLPVIKP